jgi:uncharacterized delta-60 repeat protein
MTRSLLAIVFFALAAAPGAAQHLLWVRQLGTSAFDVSSAVAVDSAGNVYISGYTEGSLGGAQAGQGDAFLSKYNSAGVLLWTRQLGTTLPDDGHALAVDSDGYVYISGTTRGSLGGPSAGGPDAYLAKYNSDGGLLWIRQRGTSAYDYSHALATDSAGGVYISGYTEGSLGGQNAGGGDAFLAKYNSAGTLLWIRQLGTSAQDHGYAVAADSMGNVYISGSTSGSLGGPNAGSHDAFLAKYSSAGVLLWVRQFGTSAYEGSSGVAVDNNGHVYIIGVTDGSLGGPSAGFRDAFLAKYDSAGTRLWIRQFGTSSWEEVAALAADSAGNVYISGGSRGSLGGPNAGDYDAFLAKYNSEGLLLWIRQLGTSAFDAGNGVALNSVGDVYISGGTGGSLGGPNAGNYDAFLAKYGPPPCYANCDGSTLTPILNVDDFTCFINAFAAGHALPHAQQLAHHSNCDASTTAPVLNIDDFTCFINAFAAGCP